MPLSTLSPRRGGRGELLAWRILEPRGAFFVRLWLLSYPRPVPIDVHSHAFVLLRQILEPDSALQSCTQLRLLEWLGRLRQSAQGHAAS